MTEGVIPDRENDYHENLYVGPREGGWGHPWNSPEALIKRDEEQYKFIQERKAKFREAYGPDLADTALAYEERHTSINGVVHFRNSSAWAKEILPLYAQELVKQFSTQPEENRTEWLTSFLEDLDRISR